MTKNEERKVLEQIENLIASTGEDSYLSYAFKGCCKIARENIDNDWACSLQDLYESTEDKLAEAQEMNRNMQRDIEVLNGANKRYQEEIFELIKKAKAEREKQIPADLYRELWLMVEAQESQAKQEIEKTADYLTLFADEPNDIEVANGLQRLLTARQKRNDATRLLEELEKYEPKNI